MKRGDHVRLRGYGGEELVRRVVDETGAHVIVCTEEEYQAALKESRPPAAVGFRKTDIVGA